MLCEILFSLDGCRVQSHSRCYCCTLDEFHMKSHSRLDECHVHSRLDEGHVHSRLDECHVHSRLDECHVRFHIS